MLNHEIAHNINVTRPHTRGIHHAKVRWRWRADAVRWCTWFLVTCTPKPTQCVHERLAINKGQCFNVRQRIHVCVCLCTLMLRVIGRAAASLARSAHLLIGFQFSTHTIRCAGCGFGAAGSVDCRRVYIQKKNNAQTIIVGCFGGSFDRHGNGIASESNLESLAL